MKARRMNGAGNRFILADVRGRAGLVSPAADQVRRWAGEFQFDQLLVLEDADGADAFMRIWNADGDEVGACGNGTRAAAQAMMQDEACDRVVIGTVGGLLHADIAASHVDWAVDQVEHVLSPELVATLERTLRDEGIDLPAAERGDLR